MMRGEADVPASAGIGIGRDLPDPGLSLAELRERLVGLGLPDGDRIVALDGLRENAYASRSRGAIVRAELGSGASAEILLKGGPPHRSRVGDPMGPAYEEVVYRDLLGGLATYPSPWLGGFRRAGWDWLLIRWHEGALRVGKGPYPAAITAAAAWLGAFHREVAPRVAPPGPAGIGRYDARRIGAWAERAATAVDAALPERSAAVTGIARRVSDLAAVLGTAPTLVHGDCYPANVLLVSGGILPIDWEWAGVAAGELDLASLLDGWPDADLVRCVAAYRAARWPDGDPGGHGARIVAARIFLALRWLGGHPLASGHRWTERCLAIVAAGPRDLDAALADPDRSPGTGTPR